MNRKEMNRKEAMTKLKAIYYSPLLDLALKAQLGEIIKALEGRK